jgi:hypothetical protein
MRSAKRLTTSQKLKATGLFLLLSPTLAGLAPPARRA